MNILPARLIATPDGVWTNADVYHYQPETMEPVYDGVELCHIAVHEDLGHPECVCVRPGAPLPDGWHWGTKDEVTALAGAGWAVSA